MQLKRKTIVGLALGLATTLTIGVGFMSPSAETSEHRAAPRRVVASQRGFATSQNNRGRRVVSLHSDDQPGHR
jgi:hypothetical protein